MKKIDTVDSSSFEETINSQEEVLIDFSASWCQPCKVLHPILEQIAEEIETPIYTLDIDDSYDIASKFKIKSVPTMVLFKKGTNVRSLVGCFPKDKILDFLKG